MKAKSSPISCQISVSMHLRRIFATIYQYACSKSSSLRYRRSAAGEEKRRFAQNNWRRGSGEIKNNGTTIVVSCMVTQSEYQKWAILQFQSIPNTLFSKVFFILDRWFIFLYLAAWNGEKRAFKKTCLKTSVLTPPPPRGGRLPWIVGLNPRPPWHLLGSDFVLLNLNIRTLS